MWILQHGKDEEEDEEEEEKSEATVSPATEGQSLMEEFRASPQVNGQRLHLSVTSHCSVLHLVVCSQLSLTSHRKSKKSKKYQRQRSNRPVKLKEKRTDQNNVKSCSKT